MQRLLENRNVDIYVKARTKQMLFRIERNGMKNPAFIGIWIFRHATSGYALKDDSREFSHRLFRRFDSNNRIIQKSNIKSF